MSDKRLLDAIGLRISTLRKMRGMKQCELGEAAGKMLNTISNIERGIGNPKITTLSAIAHALRVPLAELIVYEQPAATDENKQAYAEMIRELRKLDPDKMRMLLDIIKAVGKSSKTEEQEDYF